MVQEPVPRKLIRTNSTTVALPRSPEAVPPAPHSKLRSEYADARSVSDLVSSVEDVHHVEVHRDRLPVGYLELARDSDIGRGVGRDMVGIGKTAAQAAAVDHARAEASILPEVGCASRAGPLLCVIGVDVVVGDIGEFVSAEQILIRDYVLGYLTRPSEVAVGAEVSVLVSCAELDTRVLGGFVVEAAENERLAKLSVVQQILRDLVIGVDTDLKVGRDLLHHPRIEVMRAFRQDRALLEGVRLSGGVGERSNVGGHSDRLWRRRKISCVTGVKSRAGKRLVDQVDAGTELIGIDILPHLVEPESGV